MAFRDCGADAWCFCYNNHLDGHLFYTIQPKEYAEEEHFGHSRRNAETFKQWKKQKK
jgi:hypothetical protein